MPKTDDDLPAKSVSSVRPAGIASTQKYDAAQIDKLEGLEAVRKRPGMYIGDPDERGLHHMVFEVVDNSIDEHLAGFCDKIELTVHVDGSVSVRDNGRGIPVDIHPKWKMPAVELVLTNLHAGGKFGQGAYKYSGGLHGVGAKCTNALSDWFKVEVTREGKVYHMAFERGKTTEKLSVIGEIKNKRNTGTLITFLPDPTIFTITKSHCPMSGSIRPKKRHFFISTALRNLSGSWARTNKSFIPNRSIFRDSVMRPLSIVCCNITTATTIRFFVLLTPFQIQTAERI